MSNYQKKFSYIRDNCKSKFLDLKKSMCKKSHVPLVANYGNLVDDVENSLNDFLSSKNDSKTYDPIFDKYEEDCNKYYSLVRGNIYTDCKYKFFSPLNILLFVLLISSIALAILGFRNKGNTKIIYLSISAILILTIVVLFFFNLRKIFN